MKKLFSYFIVMFLFIFIGTNTVHASEIKKESGNNYRFSWSNLKFDYNDYKLTCSNSKITGGDTNIKEHSTGSITFTPTIKEGTITCKIYKIDTGNPELTSASITIGNTTTTKKEVTTTAPPTTTATSSNKSNNANLKTLEIKTLTDEAIEITPKFDPTVYEYKAEVVSETKKILVNVTMEDEKSNVIINGADDELKDGEDNKITITVTAEDGTKKQYVLTVLRGAKSSDATLSSLKIKQVSNFKLEEGKYKYTLNVAKNINALNIIVSTSNEKASYEIKGNKNLKDGSKVKIIVTAEDGTKKEYILTILKVKINKILNVKAEKNPLVILILSLTAFGLVGGIIYTAKKKSV